MPTVKDILARKTGEVANVREGDLVIDAAKRMNVRRIGALVVTRDQKVVGIFTERDIMCRVVAESQNPQTTKVAAVMTSPVACCHPDSTVAECRGVMTEKRIRHLPVVSESKLVGIVSIGDIVALEQREQQRTIEYLHEYLVEGTR